MSHIRRIAKVAIENKKNFLKLYKQYMAYEKQYFINIDFYLSKELYNKEYSDGEKIIIIDEIAKLKNITRERVAFKIEQVKDLFGIELKEYYLNKWYNYTNYWLLGVLYSPSEEIVIDKISEVISMRTTYSRDAAKMRVKYISEKFNVTPKTIMFQQFYKCSDQVIGEKLDRSKGSWEGSQNAFIQYIANREGVSFDKAKNRVEELYNKFGIDAFFNSKYFKMDDSKVFQIMDQKDETLMNSMIKMAKEAKMSVKDFYYERSLIMQAFGISKETYNGLKLASRNINNINSFILDSDMRYLMTKYNMSEDKYILDNKSHFANYFKEFLGREIWCNNDDSTYDSFVEFLGKLSCEEIIVKPINGLAGKGIKKFNFKAHSIRSIYKEIISMGYVIVEECIVQHDLLAEFGRGAVNTIRALTIYEKGKCNIIYALFRVGTNNTIVDNFSQGGYITRINLESGRIESDGYTYNGKIYLKDPITKKQIKGTKIPFWNEVCELLNASCEKIEKVGFVGWDIAISKCGPCLIEGNSNPLISVNEYTYPDRDYGHRHLLQEYLDEIVQ